MRRALAALTAFTALVAVAVSGAAPDTQRLPLGDGLHSTSPTRGSVYSCQTSFSQNAPGAFRDGPWIDQDAKTWSLDAKIAVAGNVKRTVHHSLKRKSGKQ